MYQNDGMRAYRNTVSAALSDREADAMCFRKLITELKLAEHTDDILVRNEAISKNQRLWSLIQKANAVDLSVVDNEDRLLFLRMADAAQKYGIKALLYPERPIGPLIEIAQNVLDGLTQTITDEGAGTP
ncbi:MULTISPECIES: flagellar biosynthesis regulator FlaF [unclassified Saccharibacter]|uniref:flagellar biosynthesis regulator FlaF n=1 Tax=unclassified Saccharibacter TaxID=2648722 RepID=UPI001329E205|nr:MULTISPECIES: flagellar biosynthesis regulator FlaF [unclassified Saccharibacter]MXV36024.1 hypothetical protein [Saccharibacter sp. EH611]MXV56883.1 hypothetical protein [Saccharibacter sp. EH70]MXV66757.1 hypothetical protein [Saccharibacter sp. EH60]